MVLSNSWVNIDLQAIWNNFCAVQKKAGVPVCAVVKANGYGHGAVQVAQLLEGHCRMFAVSSVAEALELQEAGIKTPILLLGHTPEPQLETAVIHQLRVTVSTVCDGEALSRVAEKLHKTAYAHIAVDTGMSRLGFPATEVAAEACASIARLPGVEIEGVFSHYATADEENLTAARKQAALFDRFLQLLEGHGVKPQLRHLDNSAGTMNFENHYDMVRAGIVLYGIYPSEEVDASLLPLQPAMRWETAVSHVKTLDAGCPISYGGTYVTERKTVVATIPVGYADGYRRTLSGNFYVLIGGKKAPILGRVCMDQLMVDVTEIPDAALNDGVTLIGTDGEETITVEEIARCAGSFHYEMVCGISRRVPRFYYRNGRVVNQVHYLLDT